MATIQQSTSPARERHRSIVGPVILIGLGALFLAQNTGLVSGTTWLNIWRFWPVLLILAGVEMVLGRAGWGGALATGLIAVVALGLVGFAAVSGTMLYWNSSNTFTTSIAVPTVVDQVSEDLRGIQSATVDLRHNAGRLQIGALTDDSQRFVAGELPIPRTRASTGRSRPTMVRGRSAFAMPTARTSRLVRMRTTMPGRSASRRTCPWTCRFSRERATLTSTCASCR